MVPVMVHYDASQISSLYSIATPGITALASRLV